MVRETCGLNQGNCYFATKNNFSFQGLVVPVIRNVETMNYADIERTISELGEKVQQAEYVDELLGS